MAANRKLKVVDPVEAEETVEVPEVLRAEAEEDLAFGHKHGKSEDSDSIWLISYADMMTLLMGFFALLLSMSKVDSDKAERIIEESTKYFGGEYQVPHEGLKNELQKVIDAQKLGHLVRIEAVARGVIMTFRGALFFDSGSVAVRPEAQDLLGRLAPIIQGNAKGYHITIEGHTDNVPISGGLIESNWELSGLRASTVARMFEQRGFVREQMVITGYADTQPLVPNNDPQGQPLEDNRAQNRRVVIKILKEAETP